MATMSAERREQKFAQMRERQRILNEIREGASLVPQPVPVARPAPPAPEPPPELKMYRIEDVAKMLKVSRQSVTRWFRARAVVVRTGSRETILIPRKVLDEWIAEHSGASQSA